MRTKMKKLICVRKTKVRGSLRTSQVLHGPCAYPLHVRLLPSEPWTHGPGAGRYPPRMGSLVHSPGHTASGVRAGFPTLQPLRWLRKGVAGRAEPGPFACGGKQGSCLTSMARKTGIRRIHQKPMLSLLVQHLHRPIAYILEMHAAPQPLPISAGVS